MTREQSEKLAAKILGFSKFPECGVSIQHTEQTYLRFANNGITMSGYSVEPRITVTSTREGRSGSAETTLMDDASLRAVIERSEGLAALAPVNAEHMPPPGPQQYQKTLDYDDDTAAARAPVMLPNIRAVIDAASAKNLVAAGYIGRELTATAVANKAGLFGYHLGTDARMSTTVRTSDGSSAGWDGQPSVRFREINSAAIADRAISKCVAWRNPKRLEPGRYTVILEPTAANDLVRFLATALLARPTEEGRTFFSKRGGGTKLDEKLFPDFVTLRSDPLSGQLPGLPWVTGGGGFLNPGFDQATLLPNGPMTWIEKGVLRNLAYDRYWASKTEKAPTTSPSSLVLDGGDSSVDDLIKSVERGLLVTHFWYIRFVNPQTLQYTGLTRNGLFLIENGKIAAPVMNMRFNDGPVGVLEKAQRLGRPIRVRGLEGPSMIAPAILTRDFQFTSISDAV